MRWVLLVVALLVAGAWFGGLFEARPDLPPLPSIEVTTTDPAILAQVRETRAAVEADPDDPAANGKLGSLYELYQRPEGARVCYRRAARLDPGAVRWTYHLGRVEKTWGDPAAARTALERAVSLDANYLPALALLGELDLDDGDLAGAEARFREILRRQPASCSGLLGLGRVLAERGDHAGALEQYERALAVAPRHAPLHYAAGLSQRALGNTEVAEKHFEFARENGPANPDPDPLMAEVLRLETGVQRDYREASRVLGENRPADAIPLLRKILAADPERAGAQGLLAKALMMTGDASALREYERAVELNPTNIDFLRPHGLLQLRAGDFGAAESTLREVRRLGGEHPDDHHILGIALLKQGRRSEAAVEFERVLELAPDHAEARQALRMARQ